MQERGDRIQNDIRAGGTEEQAQGKRGARAALHLAFALLANTESGKRVFIMVFSWPAVLRRDYFSSARRLVWQWDR